jgi:hypothetical protein
MTCVANRTVECAANASGAQILHAIGKRTRPLVLLQAGIDPIHQNAPADAPATRSLSRQEIARQAG